VAAQTVQIVCLREILQVARGGEAVLGLALAAWLVGSGLGAATWRLGLKWAAVLTAVLPPLVVLILRDIPVGYGGWAPGAAILAAVGAYGPGALFAAVLRAVDAPRALAREAVGACVAGLLLTLLLLTAVPALALLLGVGAICLVVGRPRSVALVPLLLLPVGSHLEEKAFEKDAGTLWPGSKLIRAIESPYGRLLWLEREAEPGVDRGTQRSLFVNGQLALTVPDEVGAEALVAVVLAAHPAPKRVLVIGVGGATILEECLRHPVKRIELAVPDRAAVELVRDLLPEKTEILTGDPRALAARAARDVVLVLGSGPSTLAGNRLYTRDFFESVNLKPGGILAFALPAAPNEREGEVMARNVSVFRALAPLKATVLPGPADLFLSSPVLAPDADPILLGAALETRGIRLLHHAQDFFKEDFRQQEVERVTRTYERYPEPVAPAVPFAVETLAPPAPEPLPNTDLHPGAVVHAAAALAQKEGVPLLGFAARASSWAPWLLLLPAALGLVFARRKAAALTAATSGAASMGMWVLLLMVYQSRVGALYGDLALLAALFMAGFAAGARSRLGVRAGETLFVAICIAVPLLLPLATMRLALLVLSALVGVVGGATLAAVAARRPEASARLYAWDLLGAACAAVLFGTFLVPALGAVPACLTAAGLKLLSLLGQLRAS
jgi:spermidine synthase